MQSERKEEMFIRGRLLCILPICLVCGCAISEGEGLSANWISVNSPGRGERLDFDGDVHCSIDRVLQDYKQNPPMPGPGTLLFEYVAEYKGNMMYVFSLEYVDDLQFGYLLDDRCNIIERIRFSSWH